ncbi:hypothetical protein DPMN_085387 [Dreissena polymorpha]|uniref:Uncharacterized protein n=1 Tax=Dreissena polymorpha TaxID=45954 RepID=A0A9D3YG28_DREPO|nr:hypothetical protein DPMN_085387 [Dreissena polymorpha]
MINCLIEISDNLYLHPTTVSVQRVRNVCFLVPFCRTDLYRHSFLAAIRLWNHLPVAVTTAQSLDSFKAGLVTLLLTTNTVFILGGALVFVTSQRPCTVTVRRCFRRAMHLARRRRRRIPFHLNK